jgi:protein-S-isoprenylcysteine O-methyltransferase Ste14
MKKMNNNKNSLESGSIKDKMKELLSISGFTLLAAFLALFLADLVFFPLAYYSVRNVDIFNLLFKYITVISLIALFAALLFLKVKTLYKNGSTLKSILTYVFLRPFQYIGFLVFILILMATLTAIIYLLFSSNYYHLHRMAGGA